ncbi:hypothetical protein RCH18_002753 [Flavobacterium sp. PL11]|jgi:hypothetical protein|uniref:hypothetical protein n=1 Tax=Flavobacterium sp. PL11 TaxID=3071717 RepID=UPI002E085F8A|nr:hypothetical protein [Flavobacterium sp. PL11]
MKSIFFVIILEINKVGTLKSQINILLKKENEILAINFASIKTARSNQENKK